MPDHIRVLVVNKSPAEAEAMARELERAGFDIEWERVDTKSDYLAALDLPPDLVLADYHLPGFDILEAISLLQNRAPFVPILAVSKPVGDEAAAEAIRLGVGAFVLKDHLTLLPHSVGSALEAKRLECETHEANEALKESEERARRLADEQQVLARMSRVMNSSLNFDQVIDPLASEVAKVIPYDWLTLASIDLDRAIVVNRWMKGPEVRSKQANIECTLEGTLAEHAMRTREPILLGGDPGEHIVRFPGLATSVEAGARSFLMVPLIGGDTVTGVLSVASRETDAYGRPDAELLDRIAAQVAGALANAELHAELEHVASEREAIAEIGRIISSSLHISETFAPFAEKVQLLIPFDRLTIAEYDLEAGSSKNRCETGTPIPETPVGASVPLPPARQDDIYQRWSRATSHDPYILQDEEAKQVACYWFPQAAADAVGLRSALLVPLVWGGRRIAMLCFRSFKDNAYSTIHTVLGTRIATQIAGAVANAQLYEALEHEAHQHEVLAEIGRISRSAPDIREVFEPLADKVRELVPFNRLTIADYDPDRHTSSNRCETGVTVPETPAGRAVSLPTGDEGGPFARWSATESSEPYILAGNEADRVAEYWPPQASANAVGLHSALFLRLVWNNRRIATMVFRSLRDYAYNSQYAVMADRIGAQIAGSVASSQLYTALQREARDREVLAEIGRIVGSSLDLGQTFERFAEQAKSLVPFDRLTIAEHDPEARTGCTLFETGDPNPATTVGMPRHLPFGEETTEFGRWSSSPGGEPYLLQGDELVEVARLWPNEKGAFEAGFGSALLAPIVWEDRRIGLLCFRSKHDNAYSNEHANYGQRIANQIAGTLANIRLFTRLEESEERYRALFENATDGVLVAEPETRRFYAASPSMCQMLGYSQKELVSLSVHDIHPEEDLEWVFERFKRQAAGELDIAMEMPVKRKDGSVFYADINSAPATIAGKDYLVGFFRDVTERKAAEEERERLLFERGERIKEIRCLYIIQRALHSAGDTPEILQEVADAIPPGFQWPDITDVRIRLDDAVCVSRPFDETEWVLSEEITVRGEPHGYIEVFLDRPPPSGEQPFLSEEKSLLYAIAAAIADTVERKLLAEEARLSQVEALNAARLASVGELAAGVAHEINNPLSGIINYAELVLDDKGLSEESQGYLGSVIKEGERIASVVRNLLSFARHQRQTHSPARVADIMESSLGLLRHRLERDRVILRLDVPQDLPLIKCRSQQIQQVFVNLITNARDALDDRFPEADPRKVLEITAQTSEFDGRPTVRIGFHDNGTGIPGESLEKLFDPFFTTKPEGKGTGLGLSISYGIIQDHHGRLWFESEEGKYTKVIVELPVDNGWTVEE